MYRPPSPEETARYSRDLLQELEAIAAQQQQHRLAELLSDAAKEAERAADSAERGRASGK
jgi:hypothetical protein